MSIRFRNLPVYDPVTNKPYIIRGIEASTPEVGFLHLGLDSSNKTRLLRCELHSRGEINSTATSSYVGSQADNYLNNEGTGYLSLLDSTTRNALSSTSIKVKDVAIGTIYEVARKCFLLSSSEVGDNTYGDVGTSILDVLKAWKETTSDDSARIATDNNGIAYGWSLRTEAHRYMFALVKNSGAQDGSVYYNQPLWRRPCLSFDPDTLVTDPDENGICYLLPDPDKPYREAEAEMLIGTPDVTPVEGILQVNSVGCMTDYPKVYFTTNYDGANTNDWYEVPIGRTFDIVGNGTDLGLKIYARTEGRCSISEPILNTGGEKDET